MPFILDLNGPASGDGYSGSYAENAPGVAIAQNATVTGLDTGKRLTGITIQISGNAYAGDLLTLASTAPDISSSWNAATKTLTLGFTNNSQGDSATLLAALNAVRFSSTGEGPNVTKTFTVTATASGNGGTDSATALINYTAVNDAPTAVNDSYSNLVAGQAHTLSVLANDSDPDGPAALTISATTGPGHGTLSIVGGALVYTPTAGYSGADSFTYTISDGALTSTATVSVTVYNPNQAPTAVATANATTALAEGSYPSAVKVADIVVTDDGVGTNSLTLAGADAASFQIIGGALYLKAGTLLNFEGKTSYSVTINVDDASVGTSPDATTTFTLTVTDVNEAPTLAAIVDASIAENATGVVATAAATDPDGTAPNNTLSYALADTYGGRFAIDASTGAISVTSAFNYEVDAHSWALSVTATDGGGLVSNTQAFTLTVTDVNEAPTLAAIVDASIAENATGVIAAAAATDPDGTAPNNTLSYALAETYGGRFAIDASTGAISVTSAFNYEVDAHSWALSVTATDGGGLVSNSQAFTLTVTDVNEAPTLAAIAPVAKSEGIGLGTLIATAVGSDPDTSAPFNTLKYSLSNTYGGTFAIDATSGAITLAKLLDYETTPSYALHVVVTDKNGAIDGLSATTNFTLTVSNDANLFSEGADTVDLNALGSRTFDFQSNLYAALGGDDRVILPNGVNLGNGLVWNPGTTFDAGAGNDRVLGGNLDDSISGGAGNDILFGGAGDDRLVGAAGDDILVGGAGADKMTGADGKDIFVFLTAAEIGTKAGAHDQITDFNQGEDRIDLSAIYGGQSGYALRTDGSKMQTVDSSKAYDVSFYTESGKTYVVGDTTGDGMADFAIELQGAFKLKAGDFIIATQADWNVPGINWNDVHQNSSPLFVAP